MLMPQEGTDLFGFVFPAQAGTQLNKALDTGLFRYER
jgi:hypothetical protein